MITRAYDGPLTGQLGDLQRRVVACRDCPRLVEYRELKATTERRASFKEWDYWGAPVPSHGDPNARLLLVGLAPASHGGNRTGRMFTGDPTAAMGTPLAFTVVDGVQRIMCAKRFGPTLKG